MTEDRVPKHLAPVPRKHRRVTTGPIAGTDPEPPPESSRYEPDENDERLKADKPPHWG